MKRILTPVLLFAFVSLSRAQVVQSSVIDQDIKARTQTIAMDLIVQGSECVGFDCPTGQSFGFSTILLKENNLRIKFEDTSVGSFPSNDWTIEANSQSNGGSNHFAILDDNGGKVPFKMIAGAPTNSIFLNSSGNLGLGTGSPTVEVHVADGDSPTLRLEQNNSAGFASQTWDLVGNETNFFVRDVTNASSLPFRIRPGSKTSSIDIKSNEVVINDESNDVDFRVEGDVDDHLFFVDAGADKVGIGTDAPNQRLHIYDEATNTPGILIEAGTSNFFKPAAGATGTAIFYKDNRFISFSPAATSSSVSANQANSVAVVGATGFLGVGTWTPTEKVDVVGNIKASGTITPSDLRLKRNVIDFDRGLEDVIKLNPKSFEYNGKGGTVNGSRHIGLIAQDLQEIIPEFVQEFSHQEIMSRSLNEEISLGPKESFLEIHDSEIKYLLINAIKDQQKIIEDQKEEIESQDERITDLEATVVELKNLILDLKNSVDVNLNGEDLGYLGQNVPNPYRGETTVTYVVPDKAVNAAINIYDTNGKFIKEVKIGQKGKGQINIHANNLPSGVYSYQLVVDGKVLDGKKMVLQ